MKAYSVILFILCLNIAAWLLVQSETLPVGQELYYSPTDLSTIFSIDAFTIEALAIGGGLAGIIAWLTKQYVFASLALVIWVISIMFNIGKGLLLGVPIMLATLLPEELIYLSQAVTALFAFILFMFFIEIASQRQIT